jgi:parallel beta-helix repeat protein
MYVKINKNISLFYLAIFVSLFQNLLYAGDTTVRTPEGRSVPADTPPEMSADDIAWCHWYIQYYYIDNSPNLNAIRIGNASNTYNCHGYAWNLSEGGQQVWIGTIEDPDVETYYWTDGAWSNDGQPSYLSASESEATQAWYNPGDHSVRKIQNSYPRSIEGGRDYVSKWGYFGLYQHAKGHDIYRLKSTTGFDFKKLKTTHSGTLSNYPKTWIGAGGKAHTITGNVTVNTGVTLTISPASVIGVISGTSLIVNGTLTANGSTSSTPITFDFISPNSSTNNGIKFNSGSSGTISYCRILHADRGIYENGVSVNISNSAIKNCTNGLYLYNSSPTIQNNNIHDNTFGIYLVSSSPYLYNNYIKNNSSIGVDCISSSNPKFGNGATQGKNDITGNANGVFCWNNSAPMLGKNSPVDGGINNLVNTSSNVYSFSSSVVYACNNWWGSTTPANFKIYGSGNVVSSPYLLSSVTIPAPPLSKSGGNLYASEVSDIPLLGELDKAYELISKNNLTEARKICLNLVTNYPDYSVSYNALNLLKEIYPASEIAAAKNMYKSLFNKKEKKDLYAMAGLILADMDKENKLKLIDDVIDSYKNESAAELALFDKFICYYFEKEDKQNALAVLKELDELLPLSQGAVEAHRILGDDEYYSIKINREQPLQKTSEQTPIQYALSDNYPNPFNPTTSIEYQIPQEGLVTLRIFDVVGREVATLVNQHNKPGKYNVEFDATNLSSGMYIYQLKANDFISTKKMMLLK